MIDLLDLHTEGGGAFAIGSYTWSFATGLVTSGLTGDSTNGFGLLLDPAARTGIVGLPGDGIPQNLMVSGAVDRILIDWEDVASTNLAGYNLYRSLSAAGPFVEYVTNLMSSTFTDTNVVFGPTYYYMVTTVKSSGSVSPASAVAGAQSLDFTEPTAPTGLAATPSDRVVGLNWNDHAESDLARYTVYRSTQPGGPYTVIQSNALLSQTADLNVTNLITYYYLVTASDLAGNESSNSVEVSATPTPFPVGLIPEHLVAMPVDFTQIDLSWQDGFGTETGFLLQRALDTNFTQQLVTFDLEANATAYADSGTLASMTYYYRLLAVNGGGSSAWSAVTSARTRDYVGGPLTVYYDFEGDFEDHPEAGLFKDDLLNVTGGVLSNDAPAATPWSSQCYYFDNRTNYQSAHTDVWSLDLMSGHAYTLMFWIQIDHAEQNGLGVTLFDTTWLPPGQSQVAPNPSPKIG
ncbi:MAG: hypothetical protein AAF492_22975, partial [Verrucomicrobiota bacterium]